MTTSMTSSVPWLPQPTWKSVFLILDKPHGYCIVCGKNAPLHQINSSVGESKNLCYLLFEYGGIYAQKEGYICRPCEQILFTIDRKIKAFRAKCLETVKKKRYLGPRVTSTSKPDHAYSIPVTDKKLSAASLVRISVRVSSEEDLCETGHPAEADLCGTGLSSDRDMYETGPSADRDMCKTGQSANRDEKTDLGDAVSAITSQLDNQPSTSTTASQRVSQPPAIDTAASSSLDLTQSVRKEMTIPEPMDEKDDGQLQSFEATSHPEPKKFQCILPKPGQISDFELLIRSGKKDSVAAAVKKMGWCRCLVCGKEFPSHEKREQHWQKHHEQNFEILRQTAETSTECTSTESSVTSTECSVTPRVCSVVLTECSVIPKRFQSILPKPGQISAMELAERSGKKASAATDVKKMTWCRCSICQIEFSSRKEREQHWQKHHDQHFEILGLSEESSTKLSVTPTECSIGDDDVKPCVPLDSAQLKKDEVTKRFKCLTCSKIFLQIEAIRKHLKGHIGKLYPCNLCDKSYRFKASFDQHMLKHTGKKHLCSECGKLFLTKNCLREHTERIHLKCWKRSHKCGTCGKSFDRLSKLKNHESKHSTERPHLCNICGKTFKLLIHLRVHQRVHPTSPVTAVKGKYECPACETSFSIEEELMNHVTVSHEQQCLHCPAAILSYQALTDHRELCPGRKSVESATSAQEDTNVITQQQPIQDTLEVLATCTMKVEQDDQM